MSSTVLVPMYKTAIHGGPLHQLFMMNCDEALSPTSCHPFNFHIFSSPTSLQTPSAVCLL